MGKGPRTSRPAAPQLPKTLTPLDLDATPLTDEAQWWRQELSGGDLCGVPAEGFEVEQCRLSRVDFSGGRWERGGWRDCDFADGNLANVHAQGCAVQRSRFTTMRATGLQWTDGVVKDVTFTGCRLDLAGFRFSRLPHVLFDDCRLTGCDFTNADLSGVRFRHCDLTGAKFHHATMAGSRLEDCTLDGINGVEAMRGATVSAADLMSLTYLMADACGIAIETGQA